MITISLIVYRFYFIKHEENHVLCFLYSCFTCFVEVSFVPLKDEGMCLTVHKYRNSINRLQKDIYPELHSALNKCKSFCSIDDPVIANKQLDTICKELHSLETYETKLIFPAILSLFDKPRENNFSPDIEEIIMLTGSKEERLTKCIGELEKEGEGYSLNSELLFYISSFISLYNNTFLPAKQIWRHQLMLLKSSDAVSCKNTEQGTCACNKNKTQTENIEHTQAHL